MRRPGVIRDERPTGRELLEFDVVGRPKGFIAQSHVHPGQVERHEVIEGGMRMKAGGTERVLRAGRGGRDAGGAGAPARRHRRGTTHELSHLPDLPGRVRVQIRPAGRTEQWLERIVAMDRDGEFLAGGWPRPVAGTRLIRDFAGDAHAAAPPPRVQPALAGGVLRAHGLFDNVYVVVDEWDVAAPPGAVFAALSDARTYPRWWRPVDLAVESDGSGFVGHSSTQRFKGRLPYRLSTRSTTIRHEPPRLREVDVEGDLRGRGTWTLTPLPDDGTRVRFDWRVFADRPLLRVLTPVLRPAFRWNHAWAIARARNGLEPFAQQLAARVEEPAPA